MTGKYLEKDYAAICSEKTLQSNEKGFFMQFVDNVTEEAGEEWIRKCFGQLRNDKERIRIVYEYEPVKAAVYHTLSHVQEIYRQKSAEVSQARRRTAEQFLRNGEIKKSLALYSQSVLRSPPTGENRSIDRGKSLALAYWGRSEALMAANSYDSALLDIRAALKENLDDSYKVEAFKRMGICYSATGEDDRAKVSFGLAEKLLENDEKLLADLRKDMRTIYKQVYDDSKKVLPTITGKNHPKYPNASNKICVKQAKGLGRFIAAQDYVKTGDTLVVEPPYTACLLPEYFGSHCHHCFERLTSPVPCPTCCSVAFCNNDCRNIALNTYHGFECKYLDLLIGSGMSILAHTALRMITQNKLRRILDIYDNRNLEQVYSSCTNDELRKPEDFFQRTLMASFLLRCLQKCGYFPERKNNDCTPSEEELKIGELLLLHLQMLQFNAHEIYETKCNKNHRFKGVKAGYIGVAIYPTSSLFNHSCYPAVTRHFVGKNIVLTAIRPINPGEVIPENYGPVFTRRSLTERQTSLSARYWFNCRCVACVQDWPSLDTGLDTVSRKIRCPTERCTFFFALPVACENMKCPRCRKNVSLTENIVSLKNCEEQLVKAIELAGIEDSENGIRLLVEAIEMFHKISVPPHRDVHLGQELLRTFLADTGNVHVCLQ